MIFENHWEHFFIGSRRSMMPHGNTKKANLNEIGSRAENGAQTRDPQLGRLVLYQLSYFRMSFFLLRCKGSDFTVANQIFPYIFLLLPCFCIKNPERESASLSGSMFLRTLLPKYGGDVL